MPINTMYKTYTFSKKKSAQYQEKTGKTEKQLEKLLSQEKLGYLPSLWKSNFSGFSGFSEYLPKDCSETKLEKLKKNGKIAFSGEVGVST